MVDSEKLEQVTAALLGLRERFAGIQREFDNAAAPVLDRISKLEAYCVQALGDMKKIETSSAVISRSSTKYASLQDWGQFVSFTVDLALREVGLLDVFVAAGIDYDSIKPTLIECLLEHGPLRYAKKDVKSSEVYAFMDANANAVPPGVSVGSKSKVTITKRKAKKTVF